MNVLDAQNLSDLNRCALVMQHTLHLIRNMWWRCPRWWNGRAVRLVQRPRALPFQPRRGTARSIHHQAAVLVAVITRASREPAPTHAYAAPGAGTSTRTPTCAWPQARAAARTRSLCESIPATSCARQARRAALPVRRPRPPLCPRPKPRSGPERTGSRAIPALGAGATTVPRTSVIAWGIRELSSRLHFRRIALQIYCAAWMPRSIKSVPSWPGSHVPYSPGIYMANAPIPRQVLSFRAGYFVLILRLLTWPHRSLLSSMTPGKKVLNFIYATDVI